MVLSFTRILAALSIAILVALAGPVSAHEHNEVAEAAETANEAGDSGMSAPDAMQEMMEHHHEAEDRPTTVSGRLAAWMGHMHPFAVHFPIALFPISWLALIIARRRGDTVDVIRALIIVAGLAAVGAAALGWLNAGFALTDRDPIQTLHRWTGTSLALIGALLALWAWRRAPSINGRSMVWALGFVTLLLLVQGALGAVLTHGMEHIMF